MVDFATRNPEAFPLSNVEAETIAKALFSVFSRMGYPKDKLLDHGSNFMSQLFGELWRMCGGKIT